MFKYQNYIEPAFGLVAKDNTICVEGRGFETRMEFFMNNDMEVGWQDLHISISKNIKIMELPVLRNMEL